MITCSYGTINFCGMFQKFFLYSKMLRMVVCIFFSNLIFWLLQWNILKSKIDYILWWEEINYNWIFSYGKSIAINLIANQSILEWALPSPLTCNSIFPKSIHLHICCILGCLFYSICFTWSIALCIVLISCSFIIYKIVLFL